MRERQGPLFLGEEEGIKKGRLAGRAGLGRVPIRALSRSVIKEKFFGVDEGPDDVLVGDLNGVGRRFSLFFFLRLLGGGRQLLAVEILEGRIQLLGIGVAAEGQQLEFTDLFFVGAARVGHESRRSAGVGGQFFLDALGIEQVKTLGQARILGALTFTGA